jgi:hypothetical protein
MLHMLKNGNFAQNSGKIIGKGFDTRAGSIILARI